ncbi:dihydrolipoamide acetyltransferase family protein [Malikia sp.]|uniref:dihydrolipoamide acetyltransferase family protein n=1 Tax=Malikia sp. TaxID=2070706 RepID=UPI0026208520|nr:dihydrolipoamide acetyltransferase family protein [Malikia sp.]MDD2729384.1 dihydrolipoamide acetyltransferase family protein [Malikia sp.]
MADFLMPALGADMETGRLVQWLVKPGDRVRRGDVVAVVETHKGAIDVEIFLDGVISELAPLGQDMKVGARLARVGPAVASPSPATSAIPAAAPTPGQRPLVSPAARRRARELGVSLEGLRGSGVGGAVVLADVERVASSMTSAPVEPVAAAAAAPPPARRGFDPSQMRQAIAAAMGRSKREIPHYYLGSPIDFQAATAWLAGYNRDREPEQRLLPAALLLKATALALRELPEFNGFCEDGLFRAGDGIHVGWAVALRGGGLIAPAIHDADRLVLPELMAALRDLVQRARAGGLRSSELTDPTVTVTSLGERGAEAVWGVIYPPQVAIIGFGRVVERPWVVDGQVVPRPLVQVSLAADHRVSDGHQGGRLLAAIDRALQSPGTL